MCEGKSGYLHYSPEIAALRAVFTFLVGEGFSPKWDDLLPRFWVSGVPCAIGRGGQVCFTFSGGDLVALFPRSHCVDPDNFEVGLSVDDVVCRFELADPGVFDHILRVVKDV